MQKRKHQIFPYLIGKEFGVQAYEEGYVLLEKGKRQDKNLMVAQELVNFFEAEDIAGDGGAVALDSQAINKRARFFDHSKEKPCFGITQRYLKFYKGDVKVSFRMRIVSSQKEGVVCRILILAGPHDEVMVDQPVKVEDFHSAQPYQDIIVDYPNPKDQPLAVKLYYEGKDDLWIDHFQWFCPKLSWKNLQDILEET